MFARAVTVRIHTRHQQRWSSISSWVLTLLVFIFMAMAVSVLWAQTSTTGEIVGVVTDPAGAALSGVTVKLTNLDSGSSTTTTTNSQGSYNSPFLQPGNYSISANAAGFQEIARKVTGRARIQRYRELATFHLIAT